MARRLYILDFDHTVFESDRFIADLRDLVSRVFDLNPAEFDANQPQYVEAGTKYYDFHGHIQALTGISPKQLNRLVGEHLPDRDYSYPDISAWIGDRDRLNEKVIVMTVGRPPFQELKFKYAKAVDGIRKLVVPKNKGEIIREHITGAPAAYRLDIALHIFEHIYLIDDSPETFRGLGQLNEVSGIRLARPNGKYQHIPTPTGTREITSLRELA
jgi:hypothetical protein